MSDSDAGLRERSRRLRPFLGVLVVVGAICLLLAVAFDTYRYATYGGAGVNWLLHAGLAVFLGIAYYFGRRVPHPS